MNDLFLSVVIPCYNEEKNLKLGMLGKVADYLKKQEYGWEVIVADDGSTDRSRKFIKQFIEKHSGFSLMNNLHQGKAATVISGMLKASGQYILFSDLDQSTPIEEVEKILPWFKKNYDVVIGSRSSERKGAPLTRRLIAVGFMVLRTLILGLSGISDTQCGFKAFKKEIAKELFGKLKLYGQKKIISEAMVTAGFDIEVLFLARKLGFRIKEVPVSWHYVDTRRVSPLKDSWRGFWDLIKIRLNDFHGKYD